MIFCEDRSSGKSKHLSIIKKAFDTIMCISKLASMTLIKYKYYFFIFEMLYLRSIRVFKNSIVKFLECRNNKCIISSKLLYQFFCIISSINTSLFKTIKLFLCLIIDDCLCCIILIRSEYHQNFICLIEYGILCYHFRYMTRFQKYLSKFF